MQTNTRSQNRKCGRKTKMKRGQKRALLLNLYQQGYDPKTAKAWLQSQACIDKYGQQLTIGKPYMYSTYKKYKQGQITAQTPSEGTGTDKPMKKEPLTIKIEGKPTPPEQLKIIQPAGATQITGQAINAENVASLFKCANVAYPEKFHERLDKGADVLGALGCQIINKYLQASSENMMLGIFVFAIALVYIYPTVITIRDWSAKKKKSKESEKPLIKRGKQAEKKALKTD